MQIIKEIKKVPYVQIKDQHSTTQKVPPKMSFEEGDRPGKVSCAHVP
jgi:hypothetical protein